MIASVAALVALAAAPGSISIDEVEMLLGSPGVTIVDVNVSEIYAEGHLPGAVHLAGPDVLAVLPKDKSPRIIFYCYSRRCSASHEAAAQAISLGYRNVFVMKDGIVGWRRAGKRLEGGSTQQSRFGP